MRPAYQLKKDTTFIEQVQKATRNTDDFGIEPTHGLFGSQEWWEQIASGRLALHTLRGVITERFWSGMADWPMVKVVNDAGEMSDWTRKVNTKEQVKPATFDSSGSIRVKVEFDPIDFSPTHSNCPEKSRRNRLAGLTNSGPRENS